ncbi:heme-binding protein [Janthinobacterium psychrotolerans]|uniref:Heme-degrading n=1 Tax=Janthinobacterium psychrotolerans TaxID=1747903 RepID=A0A1A7BZ53_9BURK|nr:Heme-degrading [Janthinobacterium psychrotolerans]
MAYLDTLQYAGHGGAFPLIIRGVGMVGTVTVSGLAQADDHALVVAALQAQLDAH